MKPRERGIPFTDDLVCAVIDGRKTQTRRPVRRSKRNADGIIIVETDNSKLWPFNMYDDGWSDENGVEHPIPCPYGKTGDLLWIREAWQTYREKNPGGEWGPETTVYRAERDAPFGWRPSIHMPRFRSRIDLRVLAVRVERVQEISEDDARAEGLAKLTKDGGRVWKYGMPDRDGLPGNDDYGWHWNEWEVDPRAAFARLWDQAYGRGAWHSNPWVWVVTFRPLGISNKGDRIVKNTVVRGTPAATASET